MKKFKMIISIIITLIIVIGVALHLAVPQLTKDSVASGVLDDADGATLGDCPDTPNCVGSEASRSEQKVERFSIANHLADNPETAIAMLADIIETQPGTAIVELNEQYLHATYTTKFMSYVDDVEFLLSDDGQSIQVRSASRIGKSDLGVNAKRVDTLRKLASEISKT